MKLISRFHFFISALIQLLLVPSLLFADTTTVTNTGNVPVRVQYKNGDSDYQDQTLKPGESKELPGGVEKVKVSREEPGQWATPLKPGQEVQVTVKEGSKPVGTLKGYGDKLIFDQPTVAPPTTAVQITSQPVQTQKTEEPVKPEPAKEPAAPKSEPPKQEAKPQEGSVTNDGYIPVVVRVQKADGTEGNPAQLQSGQSMKLPEDAVGVKLNEPIMYSGIRFPDQKPNDVTIKQPDGSTTNITDIPPGIDKPLQVLIKHLHVDLKIDYYKDSPFKTNPYKDVLKMDYKYKSSSQPDSRDMESPDVERQGQTRLQYKF